MNLSDKKTSNDLAWGLGLSVIGVFLLVAERQPAYAGILGLGFIFLIKNWLGRRRTQKGSAPPPMVAKNDKIADNKSTPFDERFKKN